MDLQSITTSLCSEGTPDPTPFLYDSTYHVAAGMMGVAASPNSASRREESLGANGNIIRTKSTSVVYQRITVEYDPRSFQQTVLHWQSSNHKQSFCRVRKHVVTCSKCALCGCQSQVSRLGSIQTRIIHNKVRET